MERANILVSLVALSSIVLASVAPNVAAEASPQAPRAPMGSTTVIRLIDTPYCAEAPGAAWILFDWDEPAWTQVAADSATGLACWTHNWFWSGTACVRAKAVLADGRTSEAGPCLMVTVRSSVDDNADDFPRCGDGRGVRAPAPPIVEPHPYEAVTTPVVTVRADFLHLPSECEVWRAELSVDGQVLPTTFRAEAGHYILEAAFELPNPPDREHSGWFRARALVVERCVCWEASRAVADFAWYFSKEHAFHLETEDGVRLYRDDNDNGHYDSDDRFNIWTGDLPPLGGATPVSTHTNPDGSTTVYQDRNGNNQPDPGETVATLPGAPRIKTESRADGSTLVYDDRDNDDQPDSGEQLAVLPATPLPNARWKDNPDGSISIYDDRNRSGTMEPDEHIVTIAK